MPNKPIRPPEVPAPDLTINAPTLDSVARSAALNLSQPIAVVRRNDVRNLWIIAVVVISTIFFFMKIMGATG